LRIGVLTSSRADFGIYLPLLKKLKKDSFFELEIIAFGTHLSHFHGYSFQHILNEKFKTIHSLETLILGDSEEAVSTAMGVTIMKFSSFWNAHRNYDLVFCLGDRYEMFSAVMAAIAFNINFAHLHGGEITTGAIDDIFRHCISHASTLHFCSTSMYEQRLHQLLNGKKNIFNVGALSLDNLLEMELQSKEEFQQQWNIDLSLPTILVTFHPETKLNQENIDYANVVATVIKESSSYQVVITMPNADSYGNGIREVFNRELQKNSRIIMIENFGTKSYLSCVKYCAFLLGNTSSGIIEAASLGKYVVNLGNRQAGRARSKNVFDVSFDRDAILSCIKKIETLPPYDGDNVYWRGGASDKIIDVLKNLHGRL
jgi:GDP/UDP-N,N'-diacetylbacillosamine 2-epimerase (hydrolysing)